MVLGVRGQILGGWVGWCVDGLEYSRWQVALVVFIACLPPLPRRKPCIQDLQEKSFEMVAVDGCEGAYGYVSNREDYGGVSGRNPS